MSLKNYSNKITILDKCVIGEDLNYDQFPDNYKIDIFDKTSNDQIISRCVDSEIIITNKVVLNRAILGQLKRLKLICVAATGTNNIDLDAAKELDIQVKNVEGYSTKSVSQLTITYALSFLNSFTRYRDYTKQGEWIKNDQFTSLDFPIESLEGKCWGVIGLGTIGKDVARIADFFGAKVQYYSTSGKNTSNSKYEHRSLLNLLKTSDIISIHAPLNSNTVNLIDKEQLGIMKENSILINVGRGGIINEVALARVLDHKKLFVALDVLQNEPMLSTSPLVDHLTKENLVITPHIAWASTQARKKLMQGICLNIETYTNNRPKG